MTVEELEILVQANIEGFIKEFQKIVPEIKKQAKQIVEHVNKMDFSGISGKVQQVVKQVKQKMASLKSSNKSNVVDIKVTTENASKQVSQLQKQIDSLQEKINARQINLDITNNALDKMRNNTRQQVISDMPDAGAKRTNQQTELRLYNDDNYMNLVKQSDKLNNEIIRYNTLLDSAKSKMAELGQETTKTGTSQNKLTSFLNAFKSKIEQAKGSMGNFKNIFSQIPKLTQNITNNIKGMGKNLRISIGHVLKYASALFSLRGIYSILSSSAQSWLSSQNAGAQQLSANIDYLKNALGSALAPIIQFVTNLVYQLMKAIQSVVYALFRVNIFANASAKSMGSVTGNTKKATKEAKQLAGVHDEINNVQTQDNSNNSGGGSGGVAPSFDLSSVDDIQSDILDAIRNGDWNEAGKLLGEKLNNALASIPWDKIQNTARKIATNIAQFLNGFIGSTDWNLVGNTFAQGLNTVIYFGYNFITTFDWKQFGKAIGDSINGFFKNVDWATAGKTLGKGIKGVFDTISTTLQEIDWTEIGSDIIAFITSIDWGEVISSLCSALGSAIGGASALIAELLLDGIIYPLADFFREKTEECGGNIILGLLKGIVDGLIGIGEWIYNNMIYPFIEAFCNALGIHSPSTVFQEFGQNIIQGLFNGIQSLVESITQIWNNIKQVAIDIFNSIKDFIINIWDAIKTTISNIINGIKDTIANILNAIKSVWENIWNGIKTLVSNIWNGIKTTISNVINGIKDTISNVLNTISSIWNNIWNGLKNTVTNIFNGIWSAIKGVINSILGGIEGMANGVINGINWVIRALNKLSFDIPDWVPVFGGKKFGFNLKTLNTISMPRLAKGGVLYEETPFIGGEYQGANSNPEIVSPQNIMYDTMRRAIEDAQFFNNNDGQTINLTVNVGNKKLGQILLEDLRDKTRQTGKGIEALVGG